ncbi:Nascent polypeptide-associated complex protein [Candidatus Heimdallarchaeota archaeon]|nr:MAG: Nascent polypeptide-associated complex protein [Candidatus Heimdallarchaeota archaeon]RLI71968.1 MAG: Nascent polypeptide-associated complex protein [Candidatus Gerdarchaeota archaeon]
MIMALNQRDLQKMMKRMKMTELKGVEEVIIRFADYELVIPNAEVTRMMMGTEVYQVTGNATKRERSDVEIIEIEISDEDIQLVASQTSVSEEEAENALLESDGDIAKAIMFLKSK